MFSVQPVFSTRFSRHGDGYRCRRGGRERTHAYVRTKDTGPTANACVRALAPSARKSRIIILLVEWKRNWVRISMNGAHEKLGPARSRFCRPVLVYTFTMQRSLPVLSPPFLPFVFIYLPLYILRPSIRQPRSRARRPH